MTRGPATAGQDTAASRRRVLSAWLGSTRTRTRVIALALVSALLVLLAHNLTAKPAEGQPLVPTSAAMEQATGVRFDRIAVVGDGGLVEVSYTVLDADKATRFQADQAHPPVLTNEASGESTKRVALMKQGHTLRVGQAYYFIYHNEGAVKSADQATITAAVSAITGFPVQ